MKLELLIDGETKIFTPPFVSGRAYRKLLEYDETIDYSNMGADDYDELIGFACNVYGDQFTIDNFWDGIPSHEVVSTLLDVFEFIRTGEDPKKKKEDDSKNDQGKS